MKYEKIKYHKKMGGTESEKHKGKLEKQEKNGGRERSIYYNYYFFTY